MASWRSAGRHDAIYFAWDTQSFHLRTKCHKMNIPSGQAVPQILLVLVAQKPDAFQLLLERPVLQPSLSLHFSDEEEAHLAHPAQIVDEVDQRLRFMDHPQIARIHHHDLSFQPMLFTEPIVLRRNRSEVVTVSPVGNQHHTMRLKADSQEAALHTADRKSVV